MIRLFYILCNKVYFEFIKSVVVWVNIKYVYIMKCVVLFGFLKFKFLKFIGSKDWGSREEGGYRYFVGFV